MNLQDPFTQSPTPSQNPSPASGASIAPSQPTQPTPVPMAQPKAPSAPAQSSSGLTSDTFKQMVASASKNPNSPAANEFVNRMKAGNYNDVITSIGLKPEQFGYVAPPPRQPNFLEKIGREILPTAGQIGGEAVGGLFGQPEVGGGIGGALGETAQQGIEMATGGRKSFDVPQIGESAATGAMLAPVGKALGKVAEFVKPVTDPLLHFAGEQGMKLLSALSDYSPEAVKNAMQAPKDVFKGATKGGEAYMGDIVTKASEKLTQMRSDVNKLFGNELKNITKTAETPSVAKLQEALGGLQNNITKTFRDSFNIGSKGGKLVFDRAVKPSAITSAAEREAVNKAYNLLNNLPKSISPEHMQATLESLGKLIKYPDGGMTKSSAAISYIKNAVEDGIKDIYPQLSTLRGQYSTVNKFIEDVNQMIPFSHELDPKTLDTAVKNLTNIFNEGKTQLRGTINEFGKTEGVDLLGASGAKQVMQPTGAAGKLLQTGLGTLAGGTVGQPGIGTIAAGFASGATKLAPDVMIQQMANPESASRLISSFMSKYGIPQKTAKAILTDIANQLQQKKSD